MKRAASSLAVACAVLLAGCSLVPQWVPFVGKREAQSARREAQKKTQARATAKPPEPKAEPAERQRPPVDDSVVDRVVAVVNNDAITWGELLQSMIAYRQENKQAPSTSDEELARQMLDRMIDARLELQEADREKVTVEDQEVTEELQDRLKQSGGKTEQDLEAVLSSQGLTMESIKRRIRDSIRTAKVQRLKVARRVSVTEAEVNRYLDENRPKLETGLTYHARHILIVPDGTSEAAWEAARASAEARKQEIDGGADFAELARKYSGDSTARDGGDLGTLKRGELAEDVERQIVSLTPGQVSQPYRSSLGYHVFRLESREALEGEGLTRVRQQIRDILFREKYDARFDAWLKEIKRRAIIDVRL
jgi:peptidyl-prolyl cis-trans isomerase SurA